MGAHADSFDVAVIGGGIIGIATALALLQTRRGSLVVLEAEADIARHQTGHNSGVIHSGIYYRPGSLKAKLCVEGRNDLYRFCQAHAVPFVRCGKLIVAADERDLPRLAELERRGRANGLQGVRRCSPAELREREPAAEGVAALLVEETGVVDFVAVTRAMATAVTRLGGEIRTGTPVQSIRSGRQSFELRSGSRSIRCANFVNCAGLHSDRIARLAGVRTHVGIVPFRGEYLHLRAESRHLVRHLVYPVPDPDLPFLGQHFTRNIDGSVELGPNAVLALARHGYRRNQISPRDVVAMLASLGFWRMARRHWRSGVEEMRRSLSLRRTADAARRLVPTLSPAHLIPGGAGVRAQAVGRDGSLLDDFHLVMATGMIHVLNAPSPAATASLAIGAHLAQQAAAVFRRPTGVAVATA
jgi:L-2-hydroxyglutarate oxidase